MLSLIICFREQLFRVTVFLQLLLIHGKSLQCGALFTRRRDLTQCDVFFLTKTLDRIGVGRGACCVPRQSSRGSLVSSTQQRRWRHNTEKNSFVKTFFVTNVNEGTLI